MVAAATPVASPPVAEQEHLRLRRMAESYLQQQHAGKVLKLRFWRGDFWEWTEKTATYSKVSLKEMKYRVLRWLCGTNCDSSMYTAEGVTHCLGALGLVADNQQMPCWLASGDSETWYLTMLNGLLVPKTRKLQAASPAWFSDSTFGYAYDAKATCPRWIAWLTEMVRDPSAIQLVQEFFGHWLVPDMSFQRALFLVGPGGTGKSTLLHVVRQVLGKQNCSSLPLKDLATEYSLSATAGKLLNISDESRELPKQAETIFKWLTGGDSITVNRKYKSWANLELSARLVVALNEWPDISDATNATYRRIEIVPMTHRIDRKRFDTQLWRTLDGELPGILNWALDGLDRLTSNGRFTTCTAGEHLLGQWQRRNQPFLDFIETRLEPSMGSFIATTDLTDSYARWCEQEGVKYPLSARALVQLVRRHVPNTLVGRRSGKRGRQERGVCNVKLL